MIARNDAPLPRKTQAVPHRAVTKAAIEGPKIRAPVMTEVLKDSTFASLSEETSSVANERRAGISKAASVP